MRLLVGTSKRRIEKQGERKKRAREKEALGTKADCTS